MTTFQCEENMLTRNDESEDVVELKGQVSKLAVENEKYRQELYELHRKLETNAAMQLELVELNEAMEQSLKNHEAEMSLRIHELEEKQIAERALLRERIEETETELIKKTKENKDLQQTIKAKNENLALNQAESMISTKDNSENLKYEIERLSELLAQQEENSKRLEDAVESAQSESNELREILAAAKGQLAETDQVLQSTKDQLTYYRMELQSLKTTPVTEICKGNSLFAEVEDRRKMTVDQMTAMRNSYLEAKRSFQAKEAEIKALKAERAMLLRKWEDDTVEKVQQDASLREKYKARIAELESQLKVEQKKQKQTEAKSQEAPNKTFSFLQSLVDTKKKEVEELRTKIENDSIKAILEEEAKHKLGKQLRHWRHRAMSVEAQLLSIKNYLESDPSSSKIEILSTIESCLKTKHNESLSGDNYVSGEARYRETIIANQTVVTLEKLMTIPNASKSHARDATSINCEDMDETACVIDLSNISGDPYKKKSTLSPPMKDESLDKVKPISSVKIEHRQSNNNNFKALTDSFNCENERPNKNSDCNGSVTPILKSVLANSNAQPNPRANVQVKETNEDDRKTLRFTEDTMDPPCKPLKKQTFDKTKYPIIFISGNKSKVENDK